MRCLAPGLILHLVQISRMHLSLAVGRYPLCYMEPKLVTTYHPRRRYLSDAMSIFAVEELNFL
jgi:hypothetical protein